MSKIESVAIVGAGPAGVIALDSLLKENSVKNVKVFDRRGEAGGCWIYDNKPVEKLPLIKDLSDKTADKLPEDDIVPWNELPKYVPKSKRNRFTDTATYEYLHSNVHKITMEYTNYPFPDAVSDESYEKYGATTPFRHNTLIKGWIQDIIKSNGYEDYFTFGVSVELIEKNPETGKWDILLRKLGGGELEYVWKESFDAIVVASGRYDVPFIPDLPGLQQFSETKKVIHSKNYRNREDFRDKKVVVVGGSISSGDTVTDLLRVAKLPVISSIRSTTVPHIYFGFYAFEHDDVERHQDLLKIEGDTVYFKDGSKVENVDAIIYGTGFTISYPFLPKLDQNKVRVKHVYQHVFNIEDPTLTFVGNIAAGLTFKAFEWQAVLAAKFLSGKLTLPSKEEQYKWEDDKLKERGDTPKYNHIYPDFEKYFNGVRDLVETCNGKGGSSLPVFDKNWEDSFWAGHKLRNDWWVENNSRRRNQKD